VNAGFSWIAGEGTVKSVLTGADGEASYALIAGSPRRRAFFFLGRNARGEFSGYPHMTIVLAEGLQELGWQISSNLQAWQLAPGCGFLFPGDGQEAALDADLIVISEDWFMWMKEARMPDLSPFGNVPAVYLDRSDLGRTTRLIYSSMLRRVDAIVRCHATGYFRYPENVQPGVFGISNRIQQACDSNISVERRGVMWNFRNKKFPHTVRVWAEKAVKPLLSRSADLQASIDAEEETQSDAYDELMRKQTEGRHFRDYYQRMGRTLVCSCLGGWFLLPVHQQEAGPVCLWGRRLLKLAGGTSSAIAQWDSWRLWEAFAAGAAVIHVDFEKHQFLLPGPLPEAMKHYVAIDIGNPEKSLSGLLEDTDALLRIGDAGRLWALEHYTPRPIAMRLLKQLALLDGHS